MNFTYACNSLTNFESEAHAMTGKSSEFVETFLAKFVKSHQVILLLAGFGYLELLCATLLNCGLRTYRRRSALFQNGITAVVTDFWHIANIQISIQTWVFHNMR